MNSLIIALAFLSSAVAFVPSAPLPKAAARMGAAAPKMALIDELPGSLPPFGTFDPANLSEDIPDSLLYWCAHARPPFPLLPPPSPVRRAACHCAFER